MTIFKRLTAGYLIIMVMVLIFGGYVAYQMNHLTRIIHKAAGVDSETIQTVEALSTRLQLLVSIEKKYWLSKEKDFYDLFFKRCHEFQDQLKDLAKLTTEAHLAAPVKEILTLSQSYLEGVARADTRNEGMPSEAYKADRDDLIDALLIHLDDLYQSARQIREQRIKESEQISTNVLQVTLGLAAACILLGLSVSFVTTRQIVSPIKLLQQKTRDIAVGNFVKIEDLKAPQEIHHLAEDFNAMSERLRELDTLKEDFVSHVSHNLRTPLTAIWEASDMLIRGTFDNDPESRAELLTIARDECKRLIESVNRILDLSRMEGGMMDYRFVSVDLDALIHDAVEKLNPIACAKQITLTIDSPPDLPLILADADQLLQLMDNLIGNALKFTDAHGRVSVTAAIPQPNDGLIQVAVSDSGCGIETANLEDIFNKFRRIEHGRDTVRGTGLGLAIAKHIVAAHGGTIWVESEKGKGSTFYFSLPHA
ncbi:Integral membrane sensor signal transduction histidine kinase [Desulfosarcina cetonica]|nr:Integral membrane sensor signal transduction histidine kinase [Desulfosarcina cetonica]